jgi:hypothetical protein
MRVRHTCLRSGGSGRRWSGERRHSDQRRGKHLSCSSDPGATLECGAALDSERGCRVGSERSVPRPARSLFLISLHGPSGRARPRKACSAGWHQEVIEFLGQDLRTTVCEPDDQPAAG